MTMICKDCLHYEVCVIVENSESTDEDYLTEFGCEDFKDRTKWVEQKHGRWRKFFRWNCGIKKEDGFTAGCCGRWVRERTIYCPNCGAKMDGERREGE